MLRRLCIRDFAIVDQLELEVAGGFTVLTGETGAGKSILIDALGLLLGDRADAAVVRSGRERAELSAEFSLEGNAAAYGWLAAHSLDDRDTPGQCILRRVIQSDGRTRALVNGSAATVNALRELGELLVEIHGQHEHQRLSRADAQRELLDDFGAHVDLVAAAETAATQHAEVVARIEQARTAAGRDPAQTDYLRFQLGELEALGLASGELERLDTEHKQLANAGRLLQDGGQAQDLLYAAENSIHDQLGAAIHLIGGLAGLHPGFAEAEALAGSAQAQVRETADQLRRLLDKLDLDPARLAEVEKRLAAIHDLARKHRIKPEALPERITQMKSELEALEHTAGDLERLQQELTKARKRYDDAAQKLSAARRNAAPRLARQVTDAVRRLGMWQAKFAVAVETEPREKPRSAGDDDICFEFSANPGQEPRPIAKVASGGELSRLSLAIRATAAGRKGPPTLVFDEVDAGIGGGVAEVVGQQLHALAEGRQVLCVTHLPQVAAQGGQQFSVRKEVRAGQTRTLVQPLDKRARAEELARMLGGVEITAQTRAHADEMLARARKNAA